MTDTEKVIAILNNIQIEANRQSETLLVASKAMADTHEILNSAVHFIRDNMQTTARTPHDNDLNRALLQYLYKATSVLGNASADMKFGKTE